MTPMDMLATTALSLFLLCFVFFFFTARKFCSGDGAVKIPPGPPRLPLLGNIFQIGEKPHRSFFDLSRIYGSVMSLKLGCLTTVVISSPEAAKQVLKTHDLALCYRISTDPVRAAGHHERSFVWLPPFARWRFLRKITTNQLSSTRRLEATKDLRSSKVQELMSFVNKCCERSEAVNIARASFITSLNIISNALFSTNLADFDDSETTREFHNVDLFLAGTDTSSSAVEWAMAELLRNPKMIVKAQEEIGQVIGENDTVHESDIIKLPYLNAVVKETLRLHPPAPFLIPRKSESEDVRIFEFLIPKSTQACPRYMLSFRCITTKPNISVLVNIWAIGRDPSVWENPTAFEPERFLGTEIDVKGNDFELIPFGAGRRICPGLPLGFMIVHLVLASLLYGFDWKYQNGVVPENVDMSEAFGVTLHKAEPICALPIKKRVKECAPALLLILSFLLTYLLFAAVKSRRRSSSPLTPEPPGPPRPLGWPIIGLLHIIEKAPHRSLANLSRLYGPVMSLRLGSLTTVIISSPEAAREVLKTLDHVFSAQTFSETVRAINHQDHFGSRDSVSLDSVSQSQIHPDPLSVDKRFRPIYNPLMLWRKILETQLFSRKCLKATKTVRSKKVKELITYMVESSERGESVEIARACFVTSLNVISNVVFSTDLGSYDPRASVELRDSLFCIMEIMAKPNLANYFPSLGFLDLQGIRKDMKVCSERLFRVFQGLIDARMTERRSQTGPRDEYNSDLLDSLIDLIQEDGSEVDMNDIKHFLYDLFISGTETNSTTVEWAMVELLRNPEAMANAKVEINFIVGPNRYVRDSDLLDFPYLQAVVTETIRLHPPSPFLIPRKAASDTEVLGFLVPENSQILVNAWAIGRDPSVWENAERFEPERFLGRDIGSIGKDLEMIPFGAGRRMCPGISLALRIVPHMLASLIYSFEWTLENEKNYVVPADLDMNETFGLTLHKTNPLYSDFVKKSPRHGADIRNLSDIRDPLCSSLTGLLWRKISASRMFSPQRLEATKSVRMKKVNELLTFMSDRCERGEPVDIARASFVTSINLISNAMFSTDLSSYDPRASLELQDSVVRIMKTVGKPNLANYFPFIGFLDLQGIRKEMKVFQGFIDGRNSEKSSRPENDLLDLLMDLVKQNGSELNVNDIKHFLLDLFIGGVDTNSSTVEWAMAELLRNPKTMAKAQAEMDDVVGPNGVVQESDTSHLPYLQALVKETLRLHPPGPFLAPHQAESNAEVLGFLVPKNAQVLVNVWAIGRDSRAWENAERFEPDRFLFGREIDLKGRDFELIPFGAGRRICPGMSLAMRTVPFILASLLHSFQWKLQNGVVPEDVDMEETFGSTLHKKNPLHAVPVKKRASG
ncbi:unnamed protein product [Thlaspi arvense]|uniref:Cytochrome P450 n=1 Tax=Thlaspi arvense TaxID=13288 RepID=A0AAU9SG78_THLAR|nr:unnamed protein product [Thlaspi arvense]